MNLQAEKLEIVRMVIDTDNPHLLESVRKLFAKESKSDFWDNLPNDQKEEILRGIEEIERGEVVDYEDFMRKFR
jgi:hypothetical protein